MSDRELIRQLKSARSLLFGLAEDAALNHPQRDALRKSAAAVTRASNRLQELLRRPKA